VAASAAMDYNHGMRKGADSTHEFFNGKHRLEHWYRDNTVYFLTVRCTDKFHALASKPAKEIFWRQFDRYTAQHGFEPWICTLMHNHYHALGYLPDGSMLALMIQKLHGSVAKLVNDQFPNRLVPFWTDYFDGCLRDENQLRRAYRYTLLQSVRHRICQDWRKYRHTKIWLNLEEGVIRARERKVYLPTVPYARYEKGQNHGG
jgi:REP element-mobilizing transposase RayT